MLFILSICIPIALLLFIIIMTYVYKVLKERDNVYVKGTILGKIDINTRKIFIYDSVFNKVIPKNFHIKRSLNKWSSLDNLLNRYKGQITEHQIRSMLVEIQSGKSFTKSSFEYTSVNNKNVSYAIVIRMFKKEDSSDIGLSIDWKLITPQKPRKSFIFNPSTKIQIADINFTYKGFIAFQLKSEIPNIASEFIYQLNKIISFKNKFYFIINGILVIVIANNKVLKLKKQILKLINIIKKKGFERGINRMYDATSYTIAKEVTTPKRINSVLDLLVFNINLSIRTGKDFTNKNTSEFNLDEYKAVSKSIRTFKETIKSNNIDSKQVNVFNIKNNRKIMIYSFPYIKDISKEIMSIILRNRDNWKNLINTYAQMVSIDSVIKEPVLVDINNSWLFDNHEKMKYKRAIYVLNYDFSNNINTDKIIQKMSKNNFTFAIRLKSFNEQITTILKRIKPQFIVVDQKLSNIKNPENYIQALSIKTMAEREGIRIIYENPSDDIDDPMVEVLGIKYVYKFN